MLKDYSELLDKTFRTEITSKISQEVKKDFPNVNERELRHFSNNVYIFATLKAYNIKEQDIIDQLVYLNNQYFDEMQENGEIMNSKINCVNVDYLTRLNEKYRKIIKNKI